MLERRIDELRIEITAALKQGNHAKAGQLHSELTAHQAALGFTPDDPPPKPKAPRRLLKTHVYHVAVNFQKIARSRAQAVAAVPMARPRLSQFRQAGTRG